MSRPPLVLDLFSGIGGFALGSTWAGCEVAGFCEIDPWCASILRKNFPGVPIHDDIRTLSGDLVREWTGGRRVDILTGGFPCQPFSRAGKQKGEEDERHLWPEMLRVVREVRPRWVVGENADGLVDLALDAVCADLEDGDYAVEPVILPACGLAAAHRRYRVWIIARARVSDANDAGCPAGARTAGWHHGDRPDAERREGASSPAQRRCDGARVPDAASDLRRASRDARSVTSDGRGDAGRACISDAGCERIGDALVSEDASTATRRARRIPSGGSADCGGPGGQYNTPLISGVDSSPNGLSGWLAGRYIDPRWRNGDPLNAFEWPSWESGLARVTPQRDKAYEDNRKEQLRALGNAVVPQIPYVIVSAIRAIEEGAVEYGV